MTREEALNKIGELVVYARAQGWDEEFTEAFETLSAEPCEDAISRQAVLSYIEFILTHGMGKKKSFEFIKKYVEKQPSVNPKQKMGRWIDSDALLIASSEDGCMKFPAKECSVCHKPHIKAYWMDYCPNCGTKMSESEDEK